MTEMNNIVKVAVDAYHNRVEKYSKSQSMELLREALIEANGGDTTINYRNIRDGKCQGVFSLVEEILGATVSEAVQQDDLFNALVDFRNVAEGDKAVFVVEDSDLYMIADVADGTQGIRRQRLAGTHTVEVPTTVKAVKIYEEMNRILSGKVDFNSLIDKVAESYRRKLLDDAYSIWGKVTAADIGGNVYFPTAGAYDEDELLDVIAHVEAAANGKTATIIGTKKALRNLAPSIQGTDSKRDIYNLGYYGRFYGSPVVAIPQRYKVGTTEFALDDNLITVVAGDEKPIKCVYEGNPLIILGDPINNADLTQEYFYADKYGMAIAVSGGNSGIGKYEITA